jgi:hypothetical protein
MIKRMILTAAAAIMLAAGANAALADLGDSDAISARKYRPMPHDTNFDAVGKDGLLHSTDNVWHEYFDNAGNVIGQIYDRHGIAIAVLYRLNRNGEYYNWEDIMRLIQRNGLSSTKDYWVRMPDESNDAVWSSRDGNYFLSVEYGDIEHHGRSYMVFIWTAQARKALSSN